MITEKVVSKPYSVVAWIFLGLEPLMSVLHFSRDACRYIQV